jgi:hypothetical protein
VQSMMDNPEKLATRRWQTNQKHNTICVGHHYAQTNTNNVNKAWALLQIMRNANILFRIRHNFRINSPTGKEQEYFSTWSELYALNSICSNILYGDGQFYWWRKQECQGKKHNDLQKVTEHMFTLCYSRVHLAIWKESNLQF